MLIEKTDIEKAKDKLGDNNAFLMAELLELENFDDKNLKAVMEQTITEYMNTEKGRQYF